VTRKDLVLGKEIGIGRRGLRELLIYNVKIVSFYNRFYRLYEDR
jgi:hypothetical protein